MAESTPKQGEIDSLIASRLRTDTLAEIAGGGALLLSRVFPETTARLRDEAASADSDDNGGLDHAS